MLLPLLTILSSCCSKSCVIYMFACLLKRLNEHCNYKVRAHYVCSTFSLNKQRRTFTNSSVQISLGASIQPLS